jgi:hypothetical protein
VERAVHVCAFACEIEPTVIRGSIGSAHGLLAVARRTEHDGCIDRLASDDGRDRVVERERFDAETFLDGRRECVGRERASGDDARRRQLGHLIANDLDARM